MRALAALHGVDGPEVESLRAALKRAKEVKVQPVDVQILSRARAHLAELDAKRSTVNANIHDAEKRLEALQQMQQFSPPPPVDAEAELRQLREKPFWLKPFAECARFSVVFSFASLSDDVSCLAKDGLPSRLPQDGTK